MIVQSVTEELRQEILASYLSGNSLWAVGQQYPWLKKHQVREALEGHVRPKNTQRRRDPTLEEIAERREQVRSTWTAEVASRRWVGRYLSTQEDRGSCLSRLFRAMGGDC